MAATSPARSTPVCPPLTIFHRRLLVFRTLSLLVISRFGNVCPCQIPVSRSIFRSSAVSSASRIPTITARFFARVMPV